jgi:hypothetical protein
MVGRKPDEAGWIVPELGVVFDKRPPRFELSLSCFDPKVF